MIESIVRFSLQRRYLLLCSIVFIAAAGWWSYQQLPVDAVPDITNVQVQINTEAPGYSPLETEQRITYPVETAMYGLPDLEYTRSLSRYGLSQVTVVFREGTDLYQARNLINERLSTVRSELPPGLEAIMGPVSTGLGEIFTYSVNAAEGALNESGQPYSATDIREIHDWIIRPQLARVSGVVEINAIGGYDKQYHVLPDPTRMLQFKVSLQDIRIALEQANDNRGAGYIERNGQQLLVRSPGQLGTISDIQQVIIARSGNSPVRLSQVADVAIGHELRTGAATLNGAETVLGTAMMLVGANARTVASDLARRIDDIRPSLPAGIELQVLYNRTTLVDKTIATVQKNLLEGALLVIVVLFLLLGNFRAALITAAVIPLSMLMTMTGMVKAGVSANLMSLGALDFGLIVDGAVIIVENCIRRLGATTPTSDQTTIPLQQRLQIVYDATLEVIRPALFGVAIITLVYIPVFALSGVEGKMFHPMAATVMMALIAAMLFCLTLVPAAVAVLMNKPLNDHQHTLTRGLQRGYQRLLEKALKNTVAILSAALLWVLACAWLVTTLGSEFIPQLDEGDIALHAMRIPGTSLQQSVQMQTQLETTLLRYPQVENVFAKIGTPEVATDPMPPNVADNFVMLKPREQWPDPTLSKAGLVRDMEQALEKIPGNNYEFTQPIQMRFNELISGVRADLGIKLFGDDLALLEKTASDILAVVNAVPGAADARSEQVSGLPVLSLLPDRDALARYGLTVADVQQLLTAAIAGDQAGQMFSGDRRFPLVVRLADEQRTDLRQIMQLPLLLADGGYVPLGEVASLQELPAPAQISRENGKRRIVISANVRGRDLGSFVADVRQRISNEVEIPSGYWLEYGGTFEQLQSATQRLSLVVPLTLAMIIILLVSALGTVRDALIVFSGVPLALTGGVMALWLRDMPLSVSAGVGFIALSGIAVLNGLVMLTFIRDCRASMALTQAIIQGAVTRLRPVLMTALVAGLGFIPMALNTGTGAEVQRPLATVVIGGILSSTLLTLIVLPLLYARAHRNSHRNDSNDPRNTEFAQNPLHSST